jgi:hypothetical protein
MLTLHGPYVIGLLDYEGCSGRTSSLLRRQKAVTSLSLYGLFSFKLVFL